MNISKSSLKQLVIILNLEKSKPAKPEAPKVKAEPKISENLKQSLQKLRDTKQEVCK